MATIKRQKKRPPSSSKKTTQIKFQMAQEFNPSMSSNPARIIQVVIASPLRQFFDYFGELNWF